MPRKTGRSRNPTLRRPSRAAWQAGRTCRKGELNEYREIHRARARLHPDRAAAGARHGSPAVHAAAPAQGAARRRGGHGGGPDRARRRQRQDGARRDRGRAQEDPEGLRRRRPALSQPRTGAGVRYRREGGAEGRRLVRHGRAPAARAGRSRRTPMPARSSPRPGVTPQALNDAINEIRKGRTADSASAENQYDALKKYARDLTAGGARRQARPGDRPRRGNPPHHPGAVAAAPRTTRC